MLRLGLMATSSDPEARAHASTAANSTVRTQSSIVDQSTKSQTIGPAMTGVAPHLALKRYRTRRVAQSTTETRMRRSMTKQRPTEEELTEICQIAHLSRVVRLI